MFYVLLVFHVLIAIFLIIIVLLQQRTQGGMASVFGGGGGAENLLGSSGVAPFLTKLTAILGTIFIFTSFLLVISGVSTGKSNVITKKQEELKHQVQKALSVNLPGNISDTTGVKSSNSISDTLLNK